MKDHVKGGALTEVTFYILLSLYTPRHGYAIIQFVKEQTQGRLILGAGTLYGALTTLQERGWITTWGSEDLRKKEYLITILGRHAVMKEMERLSALMDTARAILEAES